MLKRDNFVYIGAWMITELHLKSTELLVFAVIHSFSQDGRSVYNGGLGYLMEWTGATKQSVITALKSLIEKKLIVKTITDNGRNCLYYSSLTRAAAGKTEGQKILPNTNFSVLQSERRPENTDSPVQGQKILPEGSKNFTSEGQKIRPNTNLNTNLNTNSSSPHTEENSEESKFQEAEEELKNKLKSFFDGHYVFLNNFTKELKKLQKKNELSDDELFRYLDFVKGKMDLKADTQHPAGYFYSTALSEATVESFRFEESKKKQETENTERLKDITCPACGTGHSAYIDCPACKLQAINIHEEGAIKFHKAYFALPDDRKKAYDEECRELANSPGMDFRKRAKLYQEVQEKYGLVI